MSEAHEIKQELQNLVDEYATGLEFMNDESKANVLPYLIKSLNRLIEEIEE